MTARGGNRAGERTMIVDLERERLLREAEQLLRDIGKLELEYGGPIPIPDHISRELEKAMNEAGLKREQPPTKS
jgi:hypothetical protein